MVVGSVGCRREQKYAFGESGAHTKKIHKVSLFPARGCLKRAFEFRSVV
jgi:hypothetical protein